MSNTYVDTLTQNHSDAGDNLSVEAIDYDVFDDAQAYGNVLASYVGIDCTVIQIENIRNSVDLMVAVDALHSQLVDLQDERSQKLSTDIENSSDQDIDYLTRLEYLLDELGELCNNLLS